MSENLCQVSNCRLHCLFLGVLLDEESELNMLDLLKNVEDFKWRPEEGNSDDPQDTQGE